MTIPVIFKSMAEGSMNKKKMVYASCVERVNTMDGSSEKFPTSIVEFTDDQESLLVQGTPDDVQNTINTAVAKHESILAIARKTPLYAVFESAVADRGEPLNINEIDLSKATEHDFQAEGGNKEGNTRYKTTLPFHDFANKEPVEVLGSLEEVVQKINDALHNTPFTQ